MTNLCFLLGGFTDNGGIGRVTSIIINELCKNPEYKIYTMSYSNKNKQNLYEINVKITQDYLVEDHISMKKALLGGGIQKLRKYLNNNSIDYIIPCGALYYPLAILASKGLSTKCIAWEHSNISTIDDHSFQKFSRYFGARFSDKVVVLTKKDKKNFVEKYKLKDKVVQIYNPIDPKLSQMESNYKSDSKKILSVGRLSKAKNYALLIQIADKVLQINDSWTWDIYGDGDLRNELQAQIDTCNCKDRISLKGQVDNIYERYQDYALLVMTSKREGFPMVLLEASSCGLPLISFDILTGPNEIITNNSNGFLIEPFNTDNMVDKIRLLMKNQNKRIELSAESLNTSALFQIDSIAIQWTEIFTSSK